MGVRHLALLALVVDAVLLAAVELLFLPLRLGGVPVPVTILLAVLATPWLVMRAAELGGGVVAAAPLVAWVVAILVLGTAGPGGDVLLPTGVRSVLLLAGGIFPGAVALGRALRPFAGAPRNGPNRTR